MTKSRYKNATEKRDGGGHVAIPFAVLNGVAYLGLNARGTLLFGANTGNSQVIRRVDWRAGTWYFIH